MTHITITLTDDQLATLESIVRDGDDAAVRRRAQIIVLLHAGYTPTHLARELNVSRKTIYNVLRNFQLHGTDGVFDRPRSGRPGKADEHYCELLEKTLAHDPADYGYTDLGWSSRLLQEHLAGQTGVSLSRSRLKALLHELGYEYKRLPARIDGMLPEVPQSRQEFSRWLEMRKSLKEELPGWMSRPYHSWVKVTSD